MQNKLISEGNFNDELHSDKKMCDAFGNPIAVPDGYRLLGKLPKGWDKIQKGDLHFDIYEGWTNGHGTFCNGTNYYIHQEGRWKAWARKIEADSFSLSLDDLTGEKWTDACGFDGIFQVSNKGRIKSLGRFVSNGKSERWVKERIRKLYVGKDKRVTMMFNHENVRTSINMQALVFFSFYTDKKYLDKTYCVAHKNKVLSDNSLDNLLLIKISESHKINHSKNLLPHLKINNAKKKEDYNKLTDKTCKVCNLKKEIKLFEHGRNTCIKCRKTQKAVTYRKK